ncbi:hypothetical protein [Amycolatopsis thailandensis]|uniref:hypothetical protein n=1 Tax=Amycolatopsis thailandensis TaxID=589330 RepID=UPI00362D1CC9
MDALVCASSLPCLLISIWEEPGMVIGSRYSRAARIAATVSAVGALASGVSVVAAPMAAAGTRVTSSETASSIVASGVENPAAASAAARKGKSARALYQCITRDNTPLWFHGAILRWTNAGQGLYDVMDFGGQRIWARLWGGGSTSYQIDRWNVGWCS